MASSSVRSPDHADFPTVSMNGAMIPVAECTDMEVLEEHVRLMEDRAFDLINRLKRESSVYKVQRNSLLPVSRIPEEILIRIFRSISNEEKPIKKSKIWWDWLVLTKVCKHWRDAALRCSLLWTQVHNFSRADKVLAFLERSGQAELSIDLTARKESASEIMESLAPHMWRVRVFKFSFKDQDIRWEWLLGRLNDLTTRNKTLSISLVDSQQSRTQDYFIDAAASLETALVRPEKITLTGISASWTSTMFHGLTDLRLCDIKVQSRPYLSDILDMLQHCSELRSLTLVNAGPRPSNNLGSKSIHVPQLQIINLRKIDIEAVIQVFKHVTFRDDVRCFLSFSSYPIHRVLQFVPKMLAGRKECENINIFFIDNQISVDASLNPDWSYSVIDIGFETPEHDFGNGFQDAFEAIQVVLEQAYFREAAKIHIEFRGKNTVKIEQMNRSRWTLLFRLLPANTRDLSVILPRKIKHGMENNFIGALSDTVDSDMNTILTLHGLKLLMIYYADFSTFIGSLVHSTLLNHIERRESITGAECELGFGACEGVEEDEFLKQIRLEMEADYGSDDD